MNPNSHEPQKPHPGQQLFRKPLGSLMALAGQGGTSCSGMCHSPGG